jgi:hypothetical protein
MEFNENEINENSFDVWSSELMGPAAVSLREHADLGIPDK